LTAAVIAEKQEHSRVDPSGFLGLELWKMSTQHLFEHPVDHRRVGSTSWKNKSVAIHTAAEPPNQGKMNLAINGWT
jgi:hypothetical protein